LKNNKRHSNKTGRFTPYPSRYLFVFKAGGSPYFPSANHNKTAIFANNLYEAEVAALNFSRSQLHARLTPDPATIRKLQLLPEMTI
jgi:hypothetical protein